MTHHHCQALAEIKEPLQLKNTVSDPAASAKLRAFLKTNEPKFGEWTRERWRQFARDLTDREITAMVDAGTIPTALSGRLSDQYAALINDRYAPRWEAALKAGRDLAPKGVRELLTPEVIREWIDNRRPWLLTALTDTQRRSVEAILRHHLTTDPLDQRTLATVLRPSLGLTDRQSATLLKLHAQLKRDGVTPDNIRLQLGRAAAREQRLRSERIARTELAGAHNGGTQITMERADASGAFPKGLSRVWSAQRGKTCPICVGLNGRTAKMNAPFDGAYQLPPAHPSCRCVVLYVEGA
jgi:hypothetical protein